MGKKELRAFSRWKKAAGVNSGGAIQKNLQGSIR